MNTPYIDRPLDAETTSAAAPPVSPAPISVDPLASTAEIDAAREHSVAQRRRKRRQQQLVVRTGQVLTVVLLLGAWELLVITETINEFFFSRPSGVWAFLVDNFDSLMSHTWATFSAVAWAFVLATVSGILLGLVLGRYPYVNKIFDPMLTAFAAMPRIALAPLFLLWFGITIQSKIALAVSLVYFMMLVSTRAGVESVDSDLKTVARLLGGSDRQIFAKVILPAAVPAIFGGLRLAVLYSTLGVIASEMIAAREGLGQRIIEYGQSFRIQGVFAVLLILVILSTALTSVVKLLERHLLAWRETP